jgi:hypothetical protein
VDGDTEGAPAGISTLGRIRHDLADERTKRFDELYDRRREAG